MPQSIEDLEQQRSVIARQLSELSDFRPGSITTTTGRCGKPSCRCHQPNQPPHGPTDRLTYKSEGKTVSESLPSPAALAKAKREVEEFRNYQQLSHRFVEISTQICRLRPLEETTPQPQEKKRPKRSSGKLPAK
jgi:hypothetical protein